MTCRCPNFLVYLSYQGPSPWLWNLRKPSHSLCFKLWWWPRRYIITNQPSRTLQVPGVPRVWHPPWWRLPAGGLRRQGWRRRHVPAGRKIKQGNGPMFQWWPVWVWGAVPEQRRGERGGAEHAQQQEGPARWHSVHCCQSVMNEVL